MLKLIPHDALKDIDMRLSSKSWEDDPERHVHAFSIQSKKVKFAEALVAYHPIDKDLFVANASRRLRTTRLADLFAIDQRGNRVKLGRTIVDKSGIEDSKKLLSNALRGAS